MLMCIQNLVKFCQLVLKILSGNEILTSIKGRNSVAKEILTSFKGHNSVANFRKLMFYHSNLDLINVNVYTKIG